MFYKHQMQFFTNRFEQKSAHFLFVPQFLLLLIIILERTLDNVQFAAVCGEKSLNIHLKPNGRISEGASKVTGLTYENDILKRLGQPLVSVSADEGLKQFVMFLASSSKPFLIGHNI